MGRTYRKDRPWEDDSRSSKNKSKNFSSRSMRVLNTDVEEEYEGWDDISPEDLTETHTTKQNTNHTTKRI
jgi:hypothetical protein